MKKFSFILVTVLIGHYSLVTSMTNTGRYYAELQGFKESPEAKIIFDEDAHEGLASIQRDIITCKNLTSFQRFVRIVFQCCDVVLVTPETMPLLHGYVEDICKKANIQTPTVFITRKDWLFNAFAQKLLMSSGGILIGQKLMKELSDDSLEAVIAHELGHIKHNHINKQLVLSLLETLIQIYLIVAITKYIPVSSTRQEWAIKQDGIPFKHDVTTYHLLPIYLIYSLTSDLTSLISKLIINKRFEKEADAFACDNGKAKGIIEFFELILKKDQLREEELTTIYNLLLQNKQHLDASDYYSLLVNYYIVLAGHYISKGYRTLYYETFWGEHPSPEARIKAAQEHLNRI